MSNDPRGPHSNLPPHLADPNAFAALRDRVRAKYGAFGDRDAEAAPQAQAVSLDHDDWTRPALKIVVPLFFLSAVASLLGDRATLFTSIVWAPLLVRAMTKPPVWMSARILLLLSVFVESPAEVPRDYWNSPLDPAGFALFTGIKDWSGLPGMSLPVFFFLGAGLLYRATRKKAMRAPGFVPPPKYARATMVTFLAALIAYEAFGLAMGGALAPSFFQILEMISIPVTALAFLYAFRVPEDLPAIGRTIVLAAVLRSLFAAYVYFVVCRMRGIVPEYVTTHSDTVLFVSALVVLFADALERPKLKRVTRSLVVALVIFSAIVFNNRRLAFVGLAAAPLMIYLALRPSVGKRRVTKVLTIATPLLAVYLAVGAAVPGKTPVLAPARMLLSVLEQKDASSASRDDENYNLIYTMQQNPVLGTGFGHPYQEKIKRYAIDEFLVLYRYLPHNGVLWLWSLGGVVGFTLLWGMYPVTLTMAIRGYRAGPSPVERSAGLAALGATVVCVAQVYGDQGLLSYLTVSMFSVAFAVAARLSAPKPPPRAPLAYPTPLFR